MIVPIEKPISGCTGGQFSVQDIRDADDDSPAGGIYGDRIGLVFFYDLFSAGKNSEELFSVYRLDEIVKSLDAVAIRKKLNSLRRT